MENNWISVTEKLPEINDAVLTYVSHTFGLTIAYRNEDYKWIEDWSGEQIYAHVTHWMPLPEPPKQ